MSRPMLPQCPPYFQQAPNAPNVINLVSAPSSSFTDPPQGTFAIVNNASLYFLINKTSTTATWQLIEVSSGAGVFTTLSSTGATNLNTSGAAATNIGNASSTTTVLGTVNVNTTGSAVTTIGNAAGTAMTGSLTMTSGNLIVDTAGNGIQIKTGSDATMGTATLNGASPSTVTVATTAVKTGATIFVSYNTVAGTPGHIDAPVASIVDSTQFVINSDANGDTSTVNWLIVNPAP